jgi:hypothetical protein
MINSLPSNTSRVSFEAVKISIINRIPSLKEWFDLDNLELFKTSLPRTAIIHKKYGVVYFITGEQVSNTRRTAYTVRIIKKTGVSLVSEFQEFNTFDHAEKWLIAYLSK